MTIRYYTGVGSRDTPKVILLLMQLLAFKLASERWVLRSGGAKGADSAFFAGVKDFYDKRDTSMIPWDLAAIYIPWDGFGGHYKSRPKDFAFVFTDYDHDDALNEASNIHPNWKACDSVAKLLHGRNVFQVVGHSMDLPSEMLICWAPVTATSIKGGTRTAWEIGKRFKVRRLINLAVKADYDRALLFLGISDERLQAMTGESQKAA